ncbi:glycosyltransferase family 2 protein [Homoserinibacter sp. YIM 151385]|uniref:glycosyltransferase family 2 protein n=1 Tax=Homoserinibacter sp. YIM 151385 TaxID=2985506 RepID=UPI0022F0D2E5|nr:glycosyltransferase family 2 protein [Homoserinibacter sp. YIM 151385]WBU37770.1 glycosyltransferase family 2 protein [Homoserinibacter sp. YIM 151385]
MSGRGEVLVVTVSYSSGDVLPGLLAGIPEAGAGPVRVVVSDNGSTDGSIERTRADFPEVVVQENGANLGYGGAVNAAVAAHAGDAAWIMVVNPDSRFGPGSLDRLVDAAEAGERVGSAGPLIVDEAGTPYPSARELPSFRTGIGHALFANLWRGNPWTARYRQDDVVARGEQVPTGWLSGACLLIRREAYDAVGGFDDSYFMYFEDVDLGRKLGEAGWVNLYVPSARVVHIGATTARKSPGRTLRAHHESAYRYIARKHPEWWLAPVRLAIRAGLRLRLAWELRGRRRHDRGPL